MKSRAAVGDGRGSYDITNIVVGEPGPGEVRVALKAAGLCHTDFDALTSITRPHVMGHEGAGIVVDVGPGVDDLAAGQRVVLTWAIACGRCFQCARGNAVLCETLGRQRGGADPAATQDLSGTPLTRSFHLGTLAQATVVRREAVVPIPDTLPFESACLLGCAVMTGFGSVANVAQVEAGSSVCVIGCGGVGINAVQAARVCGADMIIAIDTNPARLSDAHRMGATELITADPQDAGLRAAALTVLDMTEGRGADYAFECTGIPALAASPLAFVRHGGVAVQVSGTETSIEVDMRLFEWNKTYINPLYGGCVPSRDYPTLFRLYQSGQLLLDELVGRTYSLDDLPEAFDDLLAGRHTKGVILL